MRPLLALRAVVVAVAVATPAAAEWTVRQTALATGSIAWATAPAHLGGLAVFCADAAPHVAIAAVERTMMDTANLVVDGRPYSLALVGATGDTRGGPAAPELVHALRRGREVEVLAGGIMTTIGLANSARSIDTALADCGP
jgi:hypothetical protein